MSKKNIINKQITQEIDTEKNEKIVQEYENDLKRLQAEFENYIKRTEKEKKQIEKNATAKMMKKLLFIIDDFEQGLSQIKDEEISNGIKMIYDNFVKFLTEQGISQINSLGDKADSLKHEVIKHEESSEEEGTILKEIQKGYLLHDDVLRPSKVIVAKKEVPQKSNPPEVIQNE